jgi:hypothetical protein
LPIEQAAISPAKGMALLNEAINVIVDGLISCELTLNIREIRKLEAERADNQSDGPQGPQE